ncbi:MAG: hypothetical protein J7M10_07685 [Candidatus Cloacimonetes bacterium]|nr:hypothetical protein [Candidatus Cloacimonadota bacterium]
MKKILILLFLITVVFFISCDKTPFKVPFDSLRDVIFNVNMKPKIEDGTFNVNTDTLFIYGDFQSWSKYEMFDVDNDSIYSKTVNGLLTSKEYEYQYGINDSLEDLQGKVRTYTVKDSGNTTSDFYGELDPTIVTFQVNMNYQVELGYFIIGSDFVDLAGNFNNWEGSSHLDDSGGDGIYEITYYNMVPDQQLEFKFRINGSWDTAEFPGGGPNRTYTVIAGENILYYWYNDEQPE